MSTQFMGPDTETNTIIFFWVCTTVSGVCSLPTPDTWCKSIFFRDIFPVVAITTEIWFVDLLLLIYLLINICALTSFFLSPLHPPPPKKKIMNMIQICSCLVHLIYLYSWVDAWIICREFPKGIYTFPYKHMITNSSS